MARSVAQGGNAADSSFDASAFEHSLSRAAPQRGPALPRPALLAAALLAALALFALVRMLAGTAQLDAQWQAAPAGTLTLLSSDQAALNAMAGRTLATIAGADGQAFEVDALALQRSPRWLVDDQRRQRLVDLQEKMSLALEGGRVTLRFTDGSQVLAATPKRGVAGLGLLFWPLAGMALLLALTGAVVWLARPRLVNLLYLVMAWCQAGNLLFIAIETVQGMGLPIGVSRHEMLLRLAFDAVTAATAVHAFALHPRRLPSAALVATAAWAVTGTVLALAAADRLPWLWWWAQGLPLALGLVALALLGISNRIEPHPFAALMRRFGVLAAATFALLSVAVAATAGRPGLADPVAVIGAVIWYVFFATLLLLVPFLARSRQALREFAMLAGIGTVAASLGVLLVAVFEVGPVASLTLAVFLALGVYASARQWIINRMVGRSVLSTERTFEQFYATARAVQAQPERHAELLSQLLRSLFEPAEVLTIDRGAAKARVVGGGSALWVPVRGSDEESTLPPALLLRLAHHGKRLFTHEDARLAERVVEQLKRAVAYDRAVERGRNEERLRIAQDLHDDIGARLLTLMYQAQSREMEDYIRNTLKDLKTLTRGLASTEHRLSHAAGDWKADISQRLTVAQVQLNWSFDIDHDPRLSMAQWSALTRVLRELVSNILQHAMASRVDMHFSLQRQRLTLTVADDGIGRAPDHWSHGLGLGGVRKRVKLLGGEVRWRDNGAAGIVCEVTVAEFGARR
jgi:signal transduction histidine kinase